MSIKHTFNDMAKRALRIKFYFDASYGEVFRAYLKVGLFLIYYFFRV